jgi:hypothetical protein
MGYLAHSTVFHQPDREFNNITVQSDKPTFIPESFSNN